MQNDTPGMTQQVAWAAGKPGAEDYFVRYGSGAHFARNVAVVGNTE